MLKRNKILEGCKHSRKMSELKKTIAKMEQNENKNFEKKMKNALIKNGWTESRAHLAANSNLKFIRKRDKDEMKKFIIERSKNIGEFKKTRALEIQRSGSSAIPGESTIRKWIKDFKDEFSETGQISSNSNLKSAHKHTGRGEHLRQKFSPIRRNVPYFHVGYAP